MRILWLTPYLPVPVFGAGTRVYSLIRALAPTCDIDLIASSDAWYPLDDLRSLCRMVELVPPSVSSRRRKRLLQLRSLVSRRPSQYWTSYSQPMQERITRALADTEYDVVILEHSFQGYYTLPGGTPTVLDQHNVESEIYLRASRHERSAVRRAYNLVEYVKYHVDEQRMCKGMGLILAASDRDRDIMQSWRDSPPCVVVPNGVDTIYFAPTDGGLPSEQPGSLVFIGSMHYSANAEAMLYFVAKIWPLILQQAPHATLQIVGGAPPPEIVQLGQLPNVTVTGSVPDVRPYLARAQVVLAPLRIGGGTRLKILEAMAMGRPVVSTSLGCEGLEVQEGRHLLIADEPARFAASVVDLLGDPAQRTALGREGRRLVEEIYDWGAVGLRMKAALRGFVNGKEPSGANDEPGCPAVPRVQM